MSMPEPDKAPEALPAEAAQAAAGTSAPETPPPETPPPEAAPAPADPVVLSEAVTISPEPVAAEPVQRDPVAPGMVTPPNEPGTVPEPEPARGASGYEAVAAAGPSRAAPSLIPLGVSLLALVVALGVGGAILGGWLKPVPPAELLAAGERLADLTQRLTRAEQKLAALEERTPLPTGGPVADPPDPALLRRLDALEAKAAEPVPLPEPPPPDPRVAPLEARVDALSARLDALGQPARPQDLDRVQEVLAARIDTLDRALDGQAARLATADRGSAVARLSAAATTSAPFVPVLETAAAAFGPDVPAAVADALAALRPVAEAGAPTLAQLRADWPALVAAIRTAQAPDDLGERLSEGLGGLVKIRRTDAAGPAGDPLVTAQAALDGGDLDGTVAALSTLEGPAATAAADWRAAAGRRLALDHGLVVLQQSLGSSPE